MVFGFADRAFCNKSGFFVLFFYCCGKLVFALIALLFSQVCPVSLGKSANRARLKQFELVLCMLIALFAVILDCLGHIH